MPYDLQTRISPHLSKFASSSIDISDGLAQDLQHLCINSKCGAYVNLNLLPLSSICKHLIKQKKIQLKKIFFVLTLLYAREFYLLILEHTLNQS